MGSPPQADKFMGSYPQADKWWVAPARMTTHATATSVGDGAVFDDAAVANAH